MGVRASVGRVAVRTVVSSLAFAVPFFLLASVASAGQISGTLTSSDQGSARGTRCDTYTLSNIFAGATIDIRHRGSNGGWGTLSDPYLYVFNSSGGIVAQNDDSEGLNSYIRIMWQSGYYIGAAAFSSSQLGTYTLWTSAGDPVASSASCGGVAAKQNQTITFTNPGTRQFRPTFTVSATSTSGLSVSIGSNTTGICQISGTTVTPIAVGTCTLTASQAGDGTFNAASSVQQSFSITKADQSITFGTLTNRTYSATQFSVSATASSGLTVSFSSTTTSICTVSGSNVTMLAEGTCTIRASQAGDTVWNAATSVDRSFVISKANQTITFGTLAAQTYSTTPFAVSATSSSGLAVTISSRTTSVCTSTGTNGTTITMLAVGTCTLQASQAGNTQFLPAVNVDQSFSINKASQTITFGSLSARTYGDAAFSVTATASSSLAVTFSSTTTGVCTVSGAQVTIVAVGNGTCTVRASQSGDAFFNAATAVDRSFTVSAKTLTATASIAARVYNGTTTPGTLTLGSLQGLVGSETLLLTATAANHASGAVGSPTSLVTFALADGTNGGRAANYTISPITVTGSITQRPLTVTATSISRASDASAPTFAVTSSGLVLGESISSATYTFAGTGSTTYGPSTTAPSATTIGNYSITPSSVVLAGSASIANYSVTYVAGTYTVTIGAAAQLSRNAATLTGASDAAFNTQPVITIQDAGGNTITTGADSSRVITATVSAGGTLIGTSTATAFEGVARFTNLGVRGLVSATYTVTYTATLNGTVRTTTQTIQPTFGVATALRIRTNAATASAGVAFGTQPIVEVVDSANNVVTSSTARVTVTASGGATLSGTNNVAAVSGVATFSGLSLAGTVTSGGTPTYDLAFAASGLTSVTQTGLSLSPGTPSRLTVSNTVSGSESGAVFSAQPTLTVLDAFGNTVTGSGNVVRATLTQVNGTGTLEGGVSAQANVSASGLEARFMRGSLSAVRATRGVAITSATTGFCHSATVTQMNSDFGFGGPGGTCGSDLFAGYWSGFITSPVSGNVTFSARVDDGFYMTINDQVVINSWIDQGRSFYNASGTFNMTANTAYAIKVWHYDNASYAAAELYWNGNSSGSTVIVPSSAFQSAPGPAVTATATTNSSGQATFSGLGINGLVGTTYEITYSATIGGVTLTTARQDVLITSGLPRSIRIDRAPAGATNGTALTTQPIVTVLDSAGNPITLGSDKTVTVTASVGGMTASNATATVTATSSGRATFSGLSLLGTSGSKTMTFAVTASNDTTIQSALGSISSTSSSLTVSPGAAAALEIQRNTATTLSSGSTFSTLTQPQIRVVDQSGNVVTTSSATVTVSLGAGSPAGTLLGTLSRSAVAGVATFTDIGIRGPTGTYRLSFAADLTTATANESVAQADADRVVLSAGAAAKLVLTNSSSMSGLSAPSGSAFSPQPVIEVRDVSDNLVTTSSASVTASVSAGATLVGTATQSALNGALTFTGLGINGTNATSYSITYSSSGLTSTSHTVTAATGTATKLALTRAAVGNQASQPFTTQPRVSILDSGNNVVSSNAAVSATVSVGGSLVGTTSATASAGLAEFGGGFGISGVAGTSYTITYASGSLATITQSITVRAGPAAALRMKTSSSTSVASGSTLATQPVVEVVDSAGNIVTTSTNAVTATVKSGSPSGVVTGTATRSPVNGVVTFSDIGLRGVAGTYTLRFTATDLTAVDQTATVNVTHGPASRVVVTNAAAVAAGSAASGAVLGVSPIVQIQDVSGNEVTTGTGRTANNTISVSASSGATVSGGATCATGGICQVGDTGPAGGKIIYVASSNQSWGRYIEAAPTGWYGTTSDPRAPYGCSTTFVAGAVGTAIGSGSTNTSAIAAACSTSGIAARIADDYSVTTRGVTYGDWFLGSRDENYQLYLNRSVFESGSLAETEATLGYYWNSGNSDTWVAQVTNFTLLGLEGGSNKNDSLRVRPLRYVPAGTGITVNAQSGRTYTLTYSASVGGVALAPGTHNVSVTAGAATQLALTRPSVGTTSGAAFSVQPQVSLRDSGGNPVTTNGVEITATITQVQVNGAATGTLVSGVTSTTATTSGGVATFSGLGISGIAGTEYTITYSSASLTTANQKIRPTVGAATQLVVTTAAAGAASGSAFTTQPVVHIRDAAGNTVTTSSARVTASISGGGSPEVLGGTAVNAVGGVATFGTLGVSGTASLTYTLTYSADLTSAVDDETITQSIGMTAGAASKLVLSTGASTTVNAGVVIPVQPVVRVTDRAGNTVASTAAITASISGGATLTNETKTAVAGTSTFVGLTATGLTGNYTITYSAPIASGLSPVSQSVSIAPGTPTQIVVDPAAELIRATSGSVLNLSSAVKVTDSGGNVVDIDSQSLTLTATALTQSDPSNKCATSASTSGVYTIVTITQTAACNWRVPLGVTNVRVAAIGGGGGGGADGGSGGGGGEMRQSTTDGSGNLSAVGAVTVSEGTDISVAVGSGGPGGGYSGASRGAAGGNTTVSWTGFSMTANGGVGGVGWGGWGGWNVRASDGEYYSPGGAGGSGGSGGYGQTGGPGGDSPKSNGHCVAAYDEGYPGGSGPALSTNLFGTSNRYGGGGGGGLEVRDVGTFSDTIEGALGGGGGGGRGAKYYGTDRRGDGGSPELDATGPGGGGGAGIACGDGYYNSATWGTRTNGGNGAAGAVIIAYTTAQTDVDLKVKTSSTGTSGTSRTATATLSDGTLGLSTLRLDGTARTYTLTYSGSVTYNSEPIALASDTQTIQLSAGTPSKLAITTQPAGAASNAAFVRQPTVAVRDSSNNLVTGSSTYTVRPVLISPASSTFSGSTTAITSEGIATFGSLGLSGVTGSHRVALTTAASSGLQMHFDAGASYVSSSPTQWRDLSGNNRHAALANLPAFTAATSSDPASFFMTESSSQNDYASVSDNLSSVSWSNGLTIQATVDFGSSAEFYERIVDFGSGSQNYNIILSRRGTENALELGVWGSGPATGRSCYENNVISSGFKNYAVTLTISGSTIVCEFYINGVSQGAPTYTDLDQVEELPQTVARTSNLIGDSNWDSADGQDLKIANLLVYNRGLTSSGIAGNAIASEVFTIDVTAGAAAALDASPATATVNAGGTVSSTAITVQDASGNTVSTSTESITAALTDGPTGYETLARLTGTTSRLPIAGATTFNDLSVSGPAGTYTITYTSGSFTATQTVTVTAGTARLLEITASDSAANSGQLFDSDAVTVGNQAVTVAIRDAFGNLVTTSTATVTATLTQVLLGATETGALVGGSDSTTASASASGGTATFTGLGLSGSDGQTYRITFSATGMTPATMDVAVSTGSATQLAVVREAGDARVGLTVGVAPIVELRDSGNNPVLAADVAISASISSGAAVNSGGSATTSSAGQATFSSLTLGGNAAESGTTYTVTYSADLTSALTNETITQSLLMRTGNVSGLTVTRTAGFTAKSGSAISNSATVTLGDPSGNAITQASGVVTASVSTGGALIGSTTVPLEAGVATFSDLGISGLAGSYTVTYTATFLNNDYSTTETISVVAGDPVRVAVTQAANGANAGIAFTTQPVLKFYDRAGNVASSNLYVTASLETLIVNGASTGTLSGTTRVQAQTNSSSGETEIAFTNLAIAGVSGQTYRLTYTVTDSSGAADVDYSPITATISLSPGAASSIVLTTEAAGAASGAQVVSQPRLEARDASGNIATAIAGSVALTITNGPTGYDAAPISAFSCVTGSGCTSASWSSGVAQFSNLALTGLAGSYQLTFAASSSASLTATQNLTLTAGTASKLTLSTAPVGTQSGVVYTTQPVVSITDARGNVVTSATTTVTVSASAGTLMGATSAITSAGVATFTDLGLSGSTDVGTHTLTFESTSGTYTAATHSYTMSAGPAAALSLTAAVGSQAGVEFSTQPVVRVVDAGGNLVTSSTAQVTATISGGADLVGTSTPLVSDGVAATATAGVATFDGVSVYGTTGSTYVITYAADGLPSVSQSLTLTSGPVRQLGLSQAADGARAGVALDVMPKVAMFDAAGNAVTTAGINVTVAITPITVNGVATGSLTGTTTLATGVDGIADFTSSGLKVNGALGQDYTLTYSVTTPNVTSVSQTIRTQVGPASRLALTRNPSSSVASGAQLEVQPIVQVQDAAGNPIPSSTAPVGVTVQRVSGAGLVVGGSTTHTAPTTSGGLANFTNLTLSGTNGETYRLSFNSDGLTSTTFDVGVTTGAATTLAITTNTSSGFSTPSGNEFSSDVVVVVRDSGGNLVNASPEVTASISCANPCSGASLVGTTTVAASAGTATFSTLGVSGTSGHIPTVLFTSPGLTSASFAPTISAGTAAQLRVTRSASSAPSGTSFTVAPQVSIQDAGGNLINGGTTSSLTITASVTQVSVSGSLTGSLVDSTGAAATTSLSATAESGVATFSNLGLSGVAGVSYTVAYTASYLSGGSTVTLTGSESVEVAVGPATSLVLTTESVGTASGAAFTTQPVVTLRDSGGNTVTSGTHYVTASASAGGSLVGTTRILLTSGVGTFTDLGITGTAGTAYSVTYRLTNSAGVATSGVSPSVQTMSVTVGAATSIALTTDAAGFTSGQSFTTQPVVTIRDSGGNTVTSGSVSITATLSAGAGGSLLDGGAPATSVTLASADGLARFTQLGLRGLVGTSYSITFATTAALSGTTSVNQTGVSLNPGSAASFNVEIGSGTAAPSGSAFSIQPIATVLDAQGNTVTSSTARVTAEITPITIGSTDTGSLVGSSSATAVEGVATFANLGITGTAGQTYTMTFKVSGLDDVTKTYTVSTGPATQLRLSRSSSGTTAGAAFTTQPQVTLLDSGGNALSTNGTAITAEITTQLVDGATTGELVGTTTASTAGGVATFSNLGAGGVSGVAYTITYSSGSLSSVTQSVTPTPGAATQLALTRSSSGTVAGQEFQVQPRLRVRDVYGNTVTNSTALVTATVSTGGTLIGTTARNAVEGLVAYTNLGVRGVAGQTYTISYALTGFTPTTESVTLAAGSAYRVSIETLAAGAASGAALTTQPVLNVRDSSGNLVSTSSATVTATITQVLSTGTLSGTTSVAAVNGVVTFSNLQVTGLAGTSYLITFSSPGLFSDSQTVLVGLGAPSSISLLQQSVGTASGAEFLVQPRVALLDSGGNIITTATNGVLASVVQQNVDGEVTGALVGVASADLANGVASFTGLGITGRSNTTYTVRYSIPTLPALSPATQNITVTVGSARALRLTTAARLNNSSTNTIVVSGSAFGVQPSLTAVDSGGNRVTTFNGAVTASVAGNGGSLIGSTSRNAISGIATFTDLGLAGVINTNYNVTYSASGLTSTTQSLSVIESLEGSLPTLSVPVSTSDGFRVTITNFDNTFNYTASTSTGARASVGSTGTVLVTGAPADTQLTVVVTSAKLNHATRSASVVGRSLEGAGLVPTFGAATATAEGFTLSITNFSTEYAWRATTTTGTASVSSTGVLSVSGVSPNTEVTATVTTTRIGHVTRTATTSAVTTLSRALTPTFSVAARTQGGFTSTITNYDSSYTYAPTVSSGGSISLDTATGQITVTGLSDGTLATVLVVTSKTGVADGSGALQGQALSAALTPLLADPVSTATGFTVDVTNYDAAYGWSPTVTFGSATIAPVTGSTGRITVTVANGVDTVLTVTSSRIGFRSASTTSTLAWGDGLRAAYGSATATSTGFTVPVSNYSSAYTWSVTATSGTAAISSSGVVTVTGMTGSTSTITVTTRQTGQSTRNTSFTYSNTPGLEASLGTPTATSDGFTVAISNYDPSYTWSASVTNGGAASIGSISGSSASVSITGLAPSTSATLTVATNRTGYSTGISTASGTSSAGAALSFTIGTATSTESGFTAPITGFDSNYRWSATSTDTNVVAIVEDGLLTVTNMTPGDTQVITVSAARTGYTTGTRTVSGTALTGRALVPVFGAMTSTTDGFSVPITNFDSAFTWTVSASSGSATRSGGTVTVTGLESNQTSTLTVGTTRTGRASGTGTFVGASLNGSTSALFSALVPTLGTVTSTSDGFRVPISNFDSNYTWSARTSRGLVTGGTTGPRVTIASGVATVIGLSAGQVDTLYVFANRSGYATGSASVDGTVLANAARASNLLSTRTMTAICPTVSAGGEDASNVNDLSANTKYSCLHAASGAVTSYTANSMGFYTSDIGSRVVTGITFTSAADNSARDPLSFTLWGCAQENENCSVIISDGRTELPTTRSADSEVSIRNNRAFSYYRLTFGSVRGASNSMQIAEVAFTGSSGLQTGLVPTLGTQSPDTTSVVVPVTNFSLLYNWAVTVTGGATASLDRTTTPPEITVANVSPQSTVTLTVTTTRTGFTTESTSLPVTTTAGAALEPNLSTPRATTSGASARIENYDTPGFTWSATTTTGGTSVGTTTIGTDGFVRVTGVPSGTAITVTVTTTRTNYTTGTNSVDITVLSSASTPTFGTATRTTDGFTVLITNYEAINTALDAEEWTLTATAGGRVSVSDAGLVTVTNLGPGVTSTVAATVRGTGITATSASVTATSIAPSRVPLFGTPSAPTAGTGFEVEITNYDATFTWGLSASAGTASIVVGDGSATLVATDPTATVTVTTTKTGYADGSATARATMGSALVPAFGTPTTSASGFTVTITNYNATSHSWTAFVTPSGSVSIASDGVATVSGLPAGADAVLTVRAAVTGSHTGIGTTNVSLARATALTPAFALPVAFSGGFTIQISNYSSDFSWAVTTSGGVAASIDQDGLITVTGVAAAESTSLTVTTTRTGYESGSATVTGSSRLRAALSPTLRSPTATSDGFTVQIDNYDSAYTWTAQVTNSGIVTVSSTGLVTVSNLPGFTEAVLSITSSRTGYASGTSTIAGTSTAGAALVPEFGVSTSAGDGYTVPLRNYDSRYTWTVTSQTGSPVTATIDSSGVITVAQMDQLADFAGRLETITVRASRTGYLDGEATFTAAARARQSTAIFAASVTAYSVTGGVATLTTSSAHGFVAGNEVLISGVGEGFDGARTILAAPLTTTFTFSTSATGSMTLDPAGTVRRSGDYSFGVTLNPARGASDSRPNVGATIQVPFSAANDGTSFVGIPSMTEEADAGYRVVTVRATATSGANVSQLEDAIRILFDAGATNAVPVTSSDNGLTWEELPQLSSAQLPAGQRHGYYRASDGTIWIYSRHLTMFGMLAPQAVPVTVSVASQISVGATTTATFSGGEGTGSLTIASSTPSICSVTSGGIVTGLAAGTCTLTATRNASGRFLDATGSASLQIGTTAVPVTVPVTAPAATEVAVTTTTSTTTTTTTIPTATTVPESVVTTTVPASTTTLVPATIATTTTTNARTALEARIEKAQETVESPLDITTARTQLVGGATAVFTVNGAVVQASVNETSLNNGYLVTEGEMSFVIQAFAEDESASPLDADGRLVVERRGTIQVAGEGFAPTSKVRVWAFSEPTLVVELFSDDAGAFEGVAEMPSSLAVGVHTVQINGVSPSGDVRSLNFGLNVVEKVADAAAETNPVAQTPAEKVEVIEAGDGALGIAETAAIAAALVAMAMVLAFAVLMIARRRRGSDVTAG